MRRAIATILTLTILVAGCSSGTTLTDAQLLWCIDNSDPVSTAGDALGLKSKGQVWGDSIGIDFEAIGIDIDTEGDLSEVLSDQDYGRYVKALDAGIEEFGISGFRDAVLKAYIEHPDGIRACIAAYGSGPTLTFAAYSSGVALTDRQMLWCYDSRGAVDDAREALGLKYEYQIWGESIGIDFVETEGDISGPIEQDMERFFDEWDAQDEELGKLGFYNVVWSAYLEHPDGIRACIAAYGLH